MGMLKCLQCGGGRLKRDRLLRAESKHVTGLVKRHTKEVCETGSLYACV